MFEMIPNEKSIISPGRRNFFQKALLAGAGLYLNQNITKANSLQEFIPEKKAKRILRIAHLTDIHAQPGLESEKGFAQALHSVNGLKDKVDFIVNGGDSIMNSVLTSKDTVRQQWKTFNNILLNENSLLIYNCVGNHDVYGWLSPSKNNEKGKDWAKDELKLEKSYYSIKRDNWKIIILDSIHPRNTIPGYMAKLDEGQMEWLSNELIESKDLFVCVVFHIPILSICSFFDGSTYHGRKMNISDNCMHADATKLKNMFFESKIVKTCLSGHIHLIDQLEYLGISYYCNGAVSGNWWKGIYKEFPPAFAVLNLYEDGSSERELHFYNWK